MTTISLNTAVLLAIQGVLASQKSFSAHDITKAIRASVNDSEYLLSDRDTEDVDGIQTQRVEHTEVRGIIDELYDAAVFGNVGMVRRFNGSFYEYSRPAQTPTRVTAATVAPQAVSVPSTPANQLLDVIKNYVQARGPVTLKQVQSRLKGTSLTCGDLAKLVQSHTDLALRPSPTLSLSTVTAV